MRTKAPPLLLQHSLDCMYITCYPLLHPPFISPPPFVNVKVHQNSHHLLPIETFVASLSPPPYLQPLVCFSILSPYHF